MGAYTTNNYFYKPALGATGETEMGYFDAALDAVDLVIKANLDAKHNQNADTDLDTTFEATFMKKADSLSDISNVGADTPTDKYALMGDGDSWESRALVEADISDLGTYATTSQTFYIGTTQVAINRASAALTLAGLTLTGVTMGGNIVMADKYITGIGSASFTQELDLGSKTAAFSVDFATDQNQKCTLTANTITLTLDTTNVGVGHYGLKIVNGGLATLTWASESGVIYFPSGDDPDLTSSGTDIVSFYYDGTNWYGQAGIDFS